MMSGSNSSRMVAFAAFLTIAAGLSADSTQSQRALNAGSPSGSSMKSFAHGLRRSFKRSWGNVKAKISKKDSPEKASSQKIDIKFADTSQAQPSVTDATDAHEKKQENPKKEKKNKLGFWSWKKKNTKKQNPNPKQTETVAEPCDEVPDEKVQEDETANGVDDKLEADLQWIEEQINFDDLFADKKTTKGTLSHVRDWVHQEMKKKRPLGLQADGKLKPAHRKHIRKLHKEFQAKTPDLLERPSPKRDGAPDGKLLWFPEWQECETANGVDKKLEDLISSQGGYVCSQDEVRKSLNRELTAVEIYYLQVWSVPAWIRTEGKSCLLHGTPEQRAKSEKEAKERLLKKLEKKCKHDWCSRPFGFMDLDNAVFEEVYAEVKRGQAGMKERLYQFVSGVCKSKKTTVKRGQKNRNVGSETKLASTNQDDGEIIRSEDLDPETYSKIVNPDEWDKKYGSQPAKKPFFRNQWWSRRKENNAKIQTKDDDFEIVRSEDLDPETYKKIVHPDDEWQSIKNIGIDSEILTDQKAVWFPELWNPHNADSNDDIIKIIDENMTEDMTFDDFKKTMQGLVGGRMLELWEVQFLQIQFAPAWIRAQKERIKKWIQTTGLSDNGMKIKLGRELLKGFSLRPRGLYKTDNDIFREVYGRAKKEIAEQDAERSPIAFIRGFCQRASDLAYAWIPPSEKPEETEATLEDTNKTEEKTSVQSTEGGDDLDTDEDTDQDTDLDTETDTASLTDSDDDSNKQEHDASGRRDVPISRTKDSMDVSCNSSSR